jgi:ferredoxin-NADP reductase
MGAGGGPQSPRARGAGRARIARIHDHCGDTRSLFLDVAGGGRLEFIPGHFISISIPLGDETRTRPYSIASSPADPGPFEICFNRVPGGRGVAWLFERAVGDVLNFTGPFGTFTLDRPPDAELIFVAEGSAIAPIRPMIARAISAAAPRKMHLLYGADRDEHILYRADLDGFARRAANNFAFETIVEPAARLYDRLAEEVERRWIKADGDRTRHFYLCGVGKGVIRLRDLLRGAGYERRAVHYEQW